VNLQEFEILGFRDGEFEFSFLLSYGAASLHDGSLRCHKSSDTYRPLTRCRVVPERRPHTSRKFNNAHELSDIL